MRESRSGRGARCGVGRAWVAVTAAAALALALGACGSASNPDGGAGDGGDAARGDGGACGAGLGACNPVSNAGCDGGQACSFGVNMSGVPTATCAMPGAGTYGSSCMSPADCAAGFTCIGDTCTKLCCAVGDDAPCQSGPGGVAGATCRLGLNGSSLMACVAPVRCDWFAQDCPNGGNCVPLSGGATSCQPAGTAAEGAPCGGATMMNCARGLVCINDGMGGGAVCRRVCNPMLNGTGGGTGDDAGDAGDASADDATSGDADVGDATSGDAGAGDAGGGDAGVGEAGEIDAAVDGGAVDAGLDAGAGDAGAGEAGADAAPPPDASGTDGAPVDARPDGGTTGSMRCPAGFTCNGIMGAPPNYGACIPM